MNPLSDRTLAHLREVTELPDAGERYEVVGFLGRGGTGAVYEAEDLLLGRRVAMKVVATGEERRAAAGRMLDEAKTIAALDHPGIVPVYDAGELPDSRVFYTMKLVRGRRLDALEAGSLAKRLRIFLRVCEAVAFAHARGVVHCDLKPENVMTGEFGEVLVMDWGTHLAGTHGFMAPEHEAGGTVGPPADVYALGRMLERLVADGAPRPIAAVIEKATSADPAERYPTARELGDEIARFLERRPVAAYRESAAERALRWLARNRTLVVLVVAYLVMRILVFVFVHR